MKVSVDFNTPITQPRGESIPTGTEDDSPVLTLGFVSEQVLANPVPEDKRDGVQRAKDWKLVLKIIGDDGYNTVELNDNQRKHLIKMIAAGYPAPMICGQAALLIDSDAAMDDEEEE